MTIEGLFIMYNISWHRVWAMTLRHIYNFRHNIDRMVDTFYWPTLDVVIWGLTLSVMERQGQTALTQVSMIIFGVILWFMVWRGQGEITVNFLEELWSENLANLFASPLRLIEWMLSLCIVGIAKLTMTIGFTSIIAFFLYKVNFLALGTALVPFIVILVLMSWAFGFMTAGLFLRYGTNIQTLAWAGAFILMPFSAVFYPLSFLPVWVQNVAQFIPATYVFEGMREVVQGQAIPFDSIAKAFGLNLMYLTLAIWFFTHSFKVAKEKGLAHLK